MIKAPAPELLVYVELLKCEQGQRKYTKNMKQIKFMKHNDFDFFMILLMI